MEIKEIIHKRALNKNFQYTIQVVCYSTEYHKLDDVFNGEGFVGIIDEAHYGASVDVDGETLHKYVLTKLYGNKKELGIKIGETITLEKDLDEQKAIQSHYLEYHKEITYNIACK